MKCVTVLETVQSMLTSPWLYLVVFTMVMVDGFLPVMPSEPVVIGLSALAASESPNLVLLAASVAGGGMAGDQISYLLGRGAGNRLSVGTMAAAMARAEHALLRYGGAAILAGRFIPCGRVATTWVSGSVQLPLSRFRMFSGLASVAWSAYMIGLGWVGGSAFTDAPLLGAAVGLTLGMVLASVYTLVEKRNPTTWSRSRDAEPAAC